MAEEAEEVVEVEEAEEVAEVEEVEALEVSLSGEGSGVMETEVSAASSLQGELSTRWWTGGLGIGLVLGLGLATCSEDRIGESKLNNYASDI